jgi:hypothetical protein
MASSVMTLQTIEFFCLRDTRILGTFNMRKYILSIDTAHM